MSFLHDVWIDLVSKRLWPVAAGLVVALVAIPLVFLQSPAEPKAPPPAFTGAGPAPLVTDPAAIAAARPSGPVVGEAKNPFKQQHVPKTDAGNGAPQSGDGPGTAGPGSGPTSGGPVDSAGSGPSTGGGGRAPSRPRRSAGDGEPRIKVRFGPSDGRRRVRTLSPGSPLPSANNATLVFIEVGRGKRIEFIVSSDAAPQGDGACKPSNDACAQLFVRPGDTEFFDVTRASGAVVQYQLDVLDVVE
ncbi:MAG TPA: hypothetical protein VNB64_11680 [Solirubrobacteraceae bacterium]|nr:hypothetical protein [Solirubrobacteraceae bacterium]